MPSSRHAISNSAGWGIVFGKGLAVSEKVVFKSNRLASGIVSSMKLNAPPSTREALLASSMTRLGLLRL